MMEYLKFAFVFYAIFMVVLMVTKPRIIFDQEGNPLTDLTYKEGKKTGFEVTYHENGQIKSKENSQKFTRSY